MPAIHLDHNTTTRPSAAAVLGMQPFFRDMWGCPTASHKPSQDLLTHMEKSYRSIYALLGAKPDDQFVFTSSGAEAVNHVINSVYRDVTTQSGKNHFITSNIDEAPTIMAIGQLENLGCSGKMAEVNKDGVVTAHAIADAITPRTALVSLSWANGLTGVVNEVEDIAALCKHRGILFHLDATHVLGKLYFDLDEINADFISFNGNQLHAPQGCGGLYIHHDKSLSPLIAGSNEQAGFRGGDINIPALIGLGIAAQEAIENRDYVCTETARLRDKLEQGLIKAVPGTKILFTQSERLPNTTTLLFEGVVNEALLYKLNRLGIHASQGGCQFQKIAVALKASGIKEPANHTAISFALSKESSEEEIDDAIGLISITAKQLQTLSTQIFT